MCVCVWAFVSLTFRDLSNDSSHSFSIFPTEILPFKKKSFLEPKAENVGIAHLFNAMSILELIIFIAGFLVCCLLGFFG